MRTPLVGAALAALTLCAHGQLVFEPRRETPIPHPPLSIFSAPPAATTGDVDGDGDVDAVTGVDPLVVLVNDGDGAFTAVPTPFSDRSGVVRLADLDADGDLDLVRSVGDDVRAALGAGDGTFGAETSLAIGTTGEVFDVVVADLTDDGVLDVLVSAADARLGVGAGDGTIASSVHVSGIQGLLVHGATAVGDFDGDAFPDVAIVRWTSAFPPFSSILLLQSQGGTAFTLLKTIGLGTGVAANADIHLEDISADGIDDVVVSNTSFGVVSFRGLGGGAFTSFQQLSAEVVRSDLVITDLDDGVVDISYIREADVIVATEVGELVTLRGPTYEPTVAATAVGIPSGDLEAVDVDGDGRTDLVHSTSFDEFVTWDHAWLRNRTYGPGEPWTDVGQGSPTTTFPTVFGQPVLIGAGTLAGGDPVTLELYGNHAPISGFLVIGTSQLGAPLKGGTLVPTPDLVVGPLPLPPGAAALELTDTLPLGIPPGTELAFQLWLQTFSASSGLVGVTP